MGSGIKMKSNNLVIEVAFPLFEYRSEVHHFTPRSPTVIERMVLRLVHDYQGVPRVAASPLLDVFEQQLGLTDAADLVIPAIDDLRVLGLLEAPIKALNLMTVADFNLTTNGHMFYSRNQLPGQEKTVRMKHVYDALNNQWLPIDIVPLDQLVFSGIELDADSFEPGNVSEEIGLCLNKQDLSWMRTDTEIQKIDAEIGEVYPNIQRLSLTVSADGNVLLEADESQVALDQWLNQVKSEYVRKYILSPVFLQSKTTNVWAALEADRLKSAAMIYPIGISEVDRAIGACFVDKPFFVLGLQEHSAFNYLDTPDLILTQAISGDVVWSDNSSFKVPSLSFDKLPDDLLAIVFSAQDALPVAVFAGETQLYWAGQAVKGKVSVTHDGGVADSIWSKIKLSLESIISKSYDPRMLAMSLLWNSPDEVMHQWMMAHTEDSLEKLLQFGLVFEQAMYQVLGKKAELCTLWQSVFFEYLIERIKTSSPFQYSELCQLMTVVRQQLLPVKGELHRSLLLNSVAIKTENQLATIRNLAGESLVFPKGLISDELIVFWLNCFVSKQKVDFSGPHFMVDDLIKYQYSFQGLSLHVSQEALNMAAAQGKLFAGRVSLKGVKEVKQWMALTEQWFEHNTLIAEASHLTNLKEEVSHWLACVTTHMHKPLASAKSWVVFDTCALIDAPTIFEYLDKSQCIALPVRVLHELDRLKQDKREENRGRANHAQQVIKNIEALGDRIVYVEQALELLPYEYSESPSADDMIISAARSLSLSPVLFISSDINLRNKAKSMELPVIATADFIKPNANLSKVRPNRKNNRSKEYFQGELS